MILRRSRPRRLSGSRKTAILYLLVLSSSLISKNIDTTLWGLVSMRFRRYLMDIQKWLEFGTSYLSDYLSDFILTLKSPSLRFHAVKESKELLLIPKSAGNKSFKFNPKLFVFLIISIFLGSTINSFAPRRPSSPEATVTIIVTLAIWFAYSLTVYGNFSLLGGKGYFWEIMSVSLQILAVVYVISNIIMLIWSILAQFLLLVFPSFFYSNILFLLQYPTISYSIVQFILMLIYLPIAIKNIYDFGKIRRAIVSFFPSLIWTGFGILVFLVSGISIPSDYDNDYMTVPTQPYVTVPTGDPRPMETPTTAYIALPSKTAKPKETPTPTPTP